MSSKRGQKACKDKSTRKPESDDDSWTSVAEQISRMMGMSQKEPSSTKTASATSTRSRIDVKRMSLAEANGTIKKMSSAVLREELKQRDLSTQGITSVLSKRLRQAVARCYGGQALGVQSKDLILVDYVVVIDFEATCVENTSKYPHEIIEVPAVLVNMKTLEIEDTFQMYCKPELHPKLSSFCTELTGITQQQVDEGKPFPEVWQCLMEWLADRGLGTDHSFEFATDGPWDFDVFLRLQCWLCKMPYPEKCKKWINVRRHFSSFYGRLQKGRPGLLTMLENLGMTFEGNLHCGLDDSKNIARIFIQLAKDGCSLALNDKLKDEFPQEDYEQRRKWVAPEGVDEDAVESSASPTSPRDLKGTSSAPAAASSSPSP